MTTLLAVDDSKTMRKVLEITFAGEDYETVLAASADEAFARLSEQKARIALVDITLGNTSGYDVCKRIKADFPAVRVMLLSSKQNPYDPAQGAASGADDHLDKPFDTQVLLDKVKALVARPPSQPAQAPTAVPGGEPTVGPTAGLHFAPDASDSMVPTAMPEGPDADMADEEEGPILIPIEEDEAPPPAVEAMRSQAPSPAAPSSRPATAAARGQHTMPAAVTNGGPTATRADFGGLESKLAELGLTEAQVNGVLILSKEVVEAAVWEVVPALAEALIKEEIRRLTQ